MTKKKQENSQSSLFLATTVLLAVIAVIMGVMGVVYQKRQRAADSSSKAAPAVERAMTATPQNPATPKPAQETAEPELQTAEEQKADNTAQPEEKYYEVRLFFIQPVDGGRFILKSTLVPVAYSNEQLLFASVSALLEGPPVKDINKGFISMIPDGSKLLSARIDNGIAYLNFNENIRFNTFGTDGYEAELKQIVYTATEFPTVSSVKFLIENREIDYLSEGINISRPLSRSSFR
jgi:germination protein M